LPHINYEAVASVSSEQEQRNNGGSLATTLEALSRTFLDSAIDCIITMDATGRVREFNPASERVFGFTRAEAVGKELADLIIPPRFREKHRQGLAHYLKTGQGPLLGRLIEIAALRRDGAEILVALAINATEIDGAPIFTAYLRDITDQKRAEEANRRLAAIIESSGDAIISIDLDLRITSWNKEAERLFGYTAAEIIGKPIAILVPPDRQNEELEIIERICRGERIIRYETVHGRKNGPPLDISLAVSPINDESGNVIGASKIARDVTERVRRERRRATQYAVTNLLAGSWTLAEVATQILEAIASSGDWAFAAIWVHDSAAGGLRCRYVWHEAAERVKKFADLSFLITLPENQGLPGRVWSSKKPTWVYDVTRDPNFPRAPYAAAAGLRGGFAFPLLFRGEINSIMELFSHNVVEPDDDFLQMVEAFGSQIGLFIERGRIELELQQEKERAGAANAARDRFLGMLSHELCAPLNPVLTWAGRTVEEPDLRPEVQQGLKMVRGNVELEIRLIEDMLDLTRIARGKIKLRLRKADAHELLQSAMEIVRSNIEDRNLKLSVALLASHYELVADPPRLEQVFWNVFRNACKFTPEKGALAVRSYNPNPRRITIEISDNGIGIEPEFVGKVFAAFEKADSRTEGLGFGLAISKAIVEMHAGTIRAHSEGRGKGATFVIELPVRGSSR
jgi:two-component system, chemotaxis family, CheB/CheR fusion protein